MFLSNASLRFCLYYVECLGHYILSGSHRYRLMTQKDMCGREIARNYGKLDADKAYAKGEKGLVQINSIQLHMHELPPNRKKQGMQIRSLEIEFLINMVACVLPAFKVDFKASALGQACLATFVLLFASIDISSLLSYC